MIKTLTRVTALLGAGVLAAAALTVPNPAAAATVPAVTGRKAWILLTGDVLGEHDYTDSPTAVLVAALRAQGYLVDDRTRDPLPADLTPYGQIWVFDAGVYSDGFPPSEIAALVGYSRTGGGLLLTGAGAGYNAALNAGRQAVVNTLMAHPVTLSAAGGGLASVNRFIAPRTLVSRPCSHPGWSRGAASLGSGTIRSVLPANVLARWASGGAAAAIWKTNTVRRHGPVALLMNPAEAAAMSWYGDLCMAKNLALFLSGLTAPPRL